LGSKIATNIPNVMLEKIFGVVLLLLIAIEMILANRWCEETGELLLSKFHITMA
jgi:uncharacterized membrane protein YfcA